MYQWFVRLSSKNIIAEGKMLIKEGGILISIFSLDETSQSKINILVNKIHQISEKMKNLGLGSSQPLQSKDRLSQIKIINFVDSESEDEKREEQRQTKQINLLEYDD